MQIIQNERNKYQQMMTEWRNEEETLKADIKER